MKWSISSGTSTISWYLLPLLDGASNVWNGVEKMYVKFIFLFLIKNWYCWWFRYKSGLLKGIKFSGMHEFFSCQGGMLISCSFWMNQLPMNVQWIEKMVGRLLELLLTNTCLLNAQKGGQSFQFTLSMVSIFGISFRGHILRNCLMNSYNALSRSKIYFSHG